MPTIKQLAQNPLYYAHKQLLEIQNARKERTIRKHPCQAQTDQSGKQRKNEKER